MRLPPRPCLSAMVPVLGAHPRRSRDRDRVEMAHNQRDERRHRRFTYLSHRRSAPLITAQIDRDRT